VRLLLDTHTLYWRAIDSPRLSRRAAAALDDPANDIVVSSVSIFELSLKNRQGKLPAGDTLLTSIASVMEQLRFGSLPLTIQHGLTAGSFAQVHRDPFDRMLAAQALVEGATLVTTDPAFADFPVHTLW